MGLYFNHPFCMYWVFRKNCVFSSTASHPSLQKIFKALNTMRVYSHSYWLANSEQPIAGRDDKIMKIREKTQFFLNTLYIVEQLTMASRGIPCRLIRAIFCLGGENSLLHHVQENLCISGHRVFKVSFKNYFLF